MWYVIQVVGGQEKPTLDLVERFVDGDVLKEAFIPRREAMRHQAGEWVKTTEILLPGYVFVVTDDPNELFLQLRSVPAFTRLLGNDRKFMPLSDSEVSFVNVFGGDDHLVEMSEGIVEGGQVRILKGPLKDHSGIIKKVDRHKRVAYVDMWMLGRCTTIQFGLEIVRKS